jgi:division protein CdvB (Snf7/Vps24/ESCRT-III family)
LVKHFTDRWKPEPADKSFASKIKNVGQPSANLKEQITTVTQRLDVQTKSLEAAIIRFQNRGTEIFNRIVKAIAQRDQARANILATELAEVRKVEKMLSHASLALQSVSMRLRTVSELGDVVAVLSPAKSLLNNVRSGMCNIMPDASQELGNIGNLLSEIVGSTSQSQDIPINTAISSADALQILEEAEVAAESRLKDRLPEVTSPETNIPKKASIQA